MENDVKTITLNDEDGKEIEFEVITKLDIQDKEYVIVIPMDSDEVDAVALRIDKDDQGSDILVSIEDDDEFELVQEAYETLFSEEDGEYKN